MMDPELDRIIEEADNPFEAFIAALIYYMVKIIFRVMEVVIDFGGNTESTD